MDPSDVARAKQLGISDEALYFTTNGAVPSEHIPHELKVYRQKRRKVNKRAKAARRKNRPKK